jgi:hypothetical protein
MRVQTVCAAIGSRRRLLLHYDGYTRVVEPHACGFTKDGHAVARVWQVAGGSVAGNPTGWKLLRLDEAFAVKILEEAAQLPRSGYRRDDPAMSRVECQV